MVGYLNYKNLYASLLVTFVTLTSSGVLAEPKEPKVIAIPNSDIKITFRHIPADYGGKPTGDPRIENKEENPDYDPPAAGFYLSETEITQAQFAAVLGAERLEQIKEFAVSKDAEIFGLGPFFEDEAYPIFLISLLDARDFCIDLEKFQPASRGAASAVLRWRIRIPSQFEWQYACRAGELENFPHFSGWPADDSLDKTKIVLDQTGESPLLEECKRLWNDLKVDQDKEFTATQENLLKLMDATDKLNRDFEGTPEKKRNAKICFAHFLKLAVGLTNDLDENTENTPTYAALDRGPPGKPNSWGLYHMHDNVTEWVIKSKLPTDVLGNWNLLEHAGNNDESKEIQSLVAAITRGGYDTDIWKHHTVWALREMKYEDWYPHDKEKVKKIALRYKAGVRVLMEAVLATNWLVGIRNEAMADNENKLTGLERLSREIPAQLGSSERESARAQIDFYRSLAHIQEGNDTEGNKILGKAKTSLDDPYFDLLHIMVEEDNK